MTAVVALVAGLCVALPGAGGAVERDRPVAGPRCQGIPATIVGTPGRDRLVGTEGRDVIVGLAGNDRIDSLGGDDLVCGGEGADRLRGGDGDDELFGERDGVVTDRGGTHLDGDRLDGGAGDDLLDPGDDTRYGGSEWQQVRFTSSDAAVTVDLGASPATATGQGADELVVAPGTVVMGSAGDDTFLGSEGDDRVMGMAGNDTASLGSGDDLFGDGTRPGAARDDDTVEGGAGSDTLDSSSGADAFTGGRGRDSLVSYGDNPATLDAGSGADRLVLGLATVAGGGADGGPGVDDLYLSRPDEIDSGPLGEEAEVPLVEIDVPAGTIRVGWDSGTTDLALAGVEEFGIANNVMLDFHGSDADETVSGPGYHPLRAWLGAGDDVVNGGAVRDQVDGGDGHDEVWGGGGRDTCVAVEAEHSC